MLQSHDNKGINFLKTLCRARQGGCWYRNRYDQHPLGQDNGSSTATSLDYRDTIEQAPFYMNFPFGNI
jgi:hypothetical protein